MGIYNFSVTQTCWSNHSLSAETWWKTTERVFSFGFESHGNKSTFECNLCEVKDHHGFHPCGAVLRKKCFRFDSFFVVDVFEHHSVFNHHYNKMSWIMTRSWKQNFRLNPMRFGILTHFVYFNFFLNIHDRNRIRRIISYTTRWACEYTDWVRESADNDRNHNYINVHM